MSLYLPVCHGVSFIVQYAPARNLQSKTLVAREVLRTLDVPQTFVQPMHERGHIPSTNGAVETTGIPCCVLVQSQRNEKRPCSSIPKISKFCRSALNGLVLSSLLSVSLRLVSVVSSTRGTTRDEFCSIR